MLEQTANTVPQLFRIQLILIALQCINTWFSVPRNNHINLYPNLAPEQETYIYIFVYTLTFNIFFKESYISSSKPCIDLKFADLLMKYYFKLK